MRIVISSDWHADRLTAGFPRYKDIESAVEETIAEALRLPKAGLYCFLGDLANPDSPGRLSF